MGLLSAYSNQKCVYQGIASSERCSVASWQRPEGASPSRLLCGCLSLPEVNLLGQIPSGPSRQRTNYSGANSNPRHCYEALPWPALHRPWAFLFSKDMSSCLESVKWLWWCIFSYSLQWVQWINEIEKSRTSSWLTINLEDSALLTQWSMRNGWPFFSEYFCRTKSTFISRAFHPLTTIPYQPPIFYPAPTYLCFSSGRLAIPCTLTLPNFFFPFSAFRSRIIKCHPLATFFGLPQSLLSVCFSVPQAHCSTFPMARVTHHFVMFLLTWLSPLLDYHLLEVPGTEAFTFTPSECSA